MPLAPPPPLSNVPVPVPVLSTSTFTSGPRTHAPVFAIPSERPGILYISPLRAKPQEHVFAHAAAHPLDPNSGQQHIFFAFEHSSGRRYGYGTREAFAEWYFSITGARCFYEIIRSDIPATPGVRIFLDLEAPREFCPAGFDELAAVERIEKLVLAHLAHISSLSPPLCPPVARHRIARLYSSNASKISWHVVFFLYDAQNREIVFSSAVSLRMFMLDLVLTRIPRDDPLYIRTRYTIQSTQAGHAGEEYWKYTFFVDMLVFTPNRVFRMFLSSKEKDPLRYMVAARTPTEAAQQIEHYRAHPVTRCTPEIFRTWEDTLVANYSPVSAEPSKRAMIDFPVFEAHQEGKLSKDRGKWFRPNYPSLSFPLPPLSTFSSSSSSSSSSSHPSGTLDTAKALPHILNPTSVMVRMHKDALYIVIGTTSRICMRKKALTNGASDTHKSNNIFWVVNPVTETYSQQCHDTDCSSVRKQDLGLGLGLDSDSHSHSCPVPVSHPFYAALIKWKTETSRFCLARELAGLFN